MILYINNLLDCEKKCFTNQIGAMKKSKKICNKKVARKHYEKGLQRPPRKTDSFWDIAQFLTVTYHFERPLLSQVLICYIKVQCHFLPRGWSVDIAPSLVVMKLLCLLVPRNIDTVSVQKPVVFLILSTNSRFTPGWRCDSYFREQH